MSDLGELLKKLRGERSLRDIAVVTDLSHTYISDVEKGFRRGSKKPIHPSPDTLKKLAEAYEYPYEELMKIAGYMEDKYKIYLYAEGQSPSDDWILFSIENPLFNIPKGTCVLGPNLPDFILEEDTDSDFLIFRIAKEMGIPDLPPQDLDKFSFMATSRLIDKIDAASFFGSAAGREMQLSLEEITLLDELRKNPETKVTVTDQAKEAAETYKTEKDIAKRLEEFKRDLASSDGLNFSGEPMSEDAKESLIEAMDHIFRQTQRINKKYIPNKHKKDED